MRDQNSISPMQVGLADLSSSEIIVIQLSANNETIVGDINDA